MSKKIECFLLEPTEFAQVSLRRFSNRRKADHWHNVSIVVESIIPVPEAMGKNNGRTIMNDKKYPKNDSRWPTRCSCGYEFTKDDKYYIDYDRLWTCEEMNGFVRLEDAPVGAMWDAHWYPFKGPDGRCLVVRTPGGDWIVDQPIHGKPWDRSGDPPKITVHPSIAIGRDEKDNWIYHGWLHHGYLV